MSLRLTWQSTLLIGRDRLLRERDRRSRLPSSGNLPTTALIGVHRSGTTSLAAWLHENDIAHTGVRKEPHYFDRYFDFGLDWYKSQFPSDRSIDASPGSIASDAFIGRMASVLDPRTRLLAIVRDPRDRAISHYRYQRQRHLELRPFAEAQRHEEDEFTAVAPRLRASATRHFSYVDRGCAGQRLVTTRQHMPQAPLLVLDFHRLFFGDQNERRRLLDFLQVPSAQNLTPFPALNRSHGERPAQIFSPWAREKWANDRPLLERLAGREMSWP